MRNGYGHMVIDYYVAQVRRVHAERAARLEAIRTREQALAYQAFVRRAIERSFAPWPERTPLHARVTGRLERQTYWIEKVILESRPGFWITANLYVPRGLEHPAPAALVSCGHLQQGKAGYQAVAQRLAAAGFVALIYDPVNQGERDQYAMLPDRTRVSGCVQAHQMMGKQMELLGEGLATWRVWDGRRALDYLLSRREVDPQHVGVTGNSGGGTLTTWLWALDERLTMAAPGCFVTTFLHNLENEEPADIEQYPIGILAAGLEMADFYIARAPQPVILLGQRYDYFDRRGLSEAHGDLQRVAGLLAGTPDGGRGLPSSGRRGLPSSGRRGLPSSGRRGLPSGGRRGLPSGGRAGLPSGYSALYIGESGHGFSEELQREMVRFFAGHAGLAEPAIAVLDAEAEADLWATSEGNTVRAGATPVYALLAERATQLAAQRPAMAPDALRARLSQLLSLPKRDAPPYYRVLRPTRLGAQTVARYAIETEGDIRAILYRRMAGPDRAATMDVGPVAHLYLPHFAAAEDLQQEPLLLNMPAAAEPYALEVRGLGESRPDEERSFWESYSLDYVAHGYGLMLGQSYLGRRVHDLLCAVDLLRAEGAREIHLYGRGQGALIALFGAVLDSRLASLTLKNSPRSYREWTEAPLVAWPAANYLRGVLQYLDLPDLVRLLEGPVTIIEPWGAGMDAWEPAGS